MKETIRKVTILLMTFFMCISMIDIKVFANTDDKITVEFCDDDGTLFEAVTYTQDNFDCYRKSPSNFGYPDEKDGKEFVYWTDTQGSEEPYYGNEYSTENDGLRLYAVYKYLYNVSYYDGDKLLAVERRYRIEPNVYYDISNMENYDPQEHVGYVFYWWLDENGNRFEGGDLSNDINLYASFDKLYTVTFCVDGRVFASIQATQHTGGIFWQSPSYYGSFEDDERLFAYWSLEENGERYDEALTGDITVYAVFTEGFVVEFYDEDETLFGTKTVSDYNNRRYSPDNLKPSDFGYPDEKYGKEFSGWTNEQGSTRIYRGEVFDGLRLYAVYLQRYNVSFYDGDKLLETIKTSSYYPGEMSIDNMTNYDHQDHEGYVFWRWVDENGETFNGELTRDISLYAEFEKLYTVTFKIDGDVFATTQAGAHQHWLYTQHPSQYGNYDDNGRVFLYWSLEENGESYDSLLAGDTTLYAVFEEAYTVKFYDEDGTPFGSMLIPQYDNSSNYAPSDFGFGDEKDGRLFYYWTNEQCSDEPYYGHPYDGLRLYAVYKEGFNVEFCDEDGTPFGFKTVTDYSYPNGSPLNLYPRDLGHPNVKDGRRFVYWTNEQGSNEEYYGDIYNGIRLYAVYLQCYSISFYDGDKLLTSFEDYQVSSYMGGIENMPNYDPQNHEGYVFWRWVDNNGKEVNGILTNDIRLYAEFEKLYTVTFKIDGEEFATTQAGAHQSWVFYRNPSYYGSFDDGRVFSHWSLEEDGEPYYGGLSGDITVHAVFSSDIVLVESIVLEKEMMSMEIGSTLTLLAEVQPKNATNQALTWTSSNPNVATVDQNGIVTALSAGKATITVSADDESGVSASCSVTVSANPESGVAYAVLTDQGNLIFLRSFLEYDNNTQATVEDIYGKEFSGTVFANVENTGAANPPWSSKAGSIKKVWVEDSTVIKPTSMYAWFAEAINLESFNASGFDTSETTTMHWMFVRCGMVKTLDLSGFDTSNVIDMECLFHSCISMESIDIGSFKTGNVTMMSGMFYDCRSLKTLDVSSFVTTEVTNMVNMFQLCSSLTVLDLKNFNTSKVTDMRHMFNGCSSLTSLDISSFDNSKVTKMTSMFNNCNSLSSIKLGTGFTKWIDNAYLPAGTWENGTLRKTSVELYKDYPLHASEWTGTWNRIVSATSVSLSEHSVSVTKGNSKQLSATILPENATYKSLSWASSNTEVATVDENGLVTSIKPGESIITVTTTDGTNLSDSCTFVVNSIYRFETIRWNEDNTAVGLFSDNDGNEVEVNATVTSVTKEATCTQEGTLTYVASVEYDGVTGTDTKVIVIPALGHVPLDPVEENRVEATVAREGHYDSVVYCERCHEELSRDTIIIPIIVSEELVILEKNNGKKYCCVGSGLDYSEEGTIYIESTGKYYYYVTGWQKLDSKWYYFNPYMYTSCMAGINEKHYYFDTNGVMLTGWISDTNINGEKIWYYALSNGELVTEWQKINNKWYFFHPDSFIMFSGGAWEIYGKAYYLDSSGAMRTGWISTVNDDGETIWCYAQPNGELVTGWQKINGKWYYFYPEGYAMYPEGIREINGEKYYFDKSGAMQTGWFTKDGFICYSNSSGVIQKGWQSIDGKWYYFDPDDYHMYKNGETYINDKTYYFDENGIMQTGWIKATTGIDGVSFVVWYYAKSNGELVSGWQRINEKWYYFIRGQFDYSLVRSNVYDIDGKIYLFNDDGSLATSKGWVNTYDKWYYGNSDGTAATGWMSIGGKWYYFETSGVMVTGYNYIDGVLYSFTDSGALVGSVTGLGWHRDIYDSGENLYYILPDGKLATGWQSFDGERYYFDLYYHYAYIGGHSIDGKLYLFNDDASLTSKTGWIKVNGEWYYRTPDGAVTTGWKYIDGKQYYFGYDGIMYANTIVQSEDSSKVYFIDAGGTIVSKEGWQKITYENGYGVYDVWYYVGTDGVCKTGWQKINNKWYFLYPNDYGLRSDTGVMASGTTVFDSNNKVYFVNADGSLVSKEGWQKITHKSSNGEWYEWYYVGADGVCKSGWQKIDGTWYYFNGYDCQMLSDGVYCIDDQVHRFNASGAWLGTVD